MRRVVLYDHPDVDAYEEDGVVYEALSSKEYRTYEDGTMPLERQVIVDKMFILKEESVLAEERDALRELLRIRKWCEQNGEIEEIEDTSHGSLMDEITEVLHEIDWLTSNIAKLRKHAEECQKLLDEQQKQEK